MTTISCDYCWARTSYWKYDNHGARVCQDEQECLKSKERRMDDTIIALHAMGRRVYGDDWLDVGPELIWRFSRRIYKGIARIRTNAITGTSRRNVQRKGKRMMETTKEMLDNLPVIAYKCKGCAENGNPDFMFNADYLYGFQAQTKPNMKIFHRLDSIVSIA